MPRAASRGSRFSDRRAGHAAQGALELHHAVVRPAGAHPVRAVRRRRQVRVRHRDHPARHRLDVGEDAVAVRRVEDREPRDHVSLRAGVPAEEVVPGVRVLSLGLLHADHVGTAHLDDVREPVQRPRAPVRDRAEVAGGQVVVVAAVEDVLRHHRHLHGRRQRRCDRLRVGRHRRCEQHARRQRDRGQGRGDEAEDAHVPSMAVSVEQRNSSAGHSCESGTPPGIGAWGSYGVRVSTKVAHSRWLDRVPSSRRTTCRVSPAR